MDSPSEHTILVVDDEESICKAVRRILKSHGIRTAFAGSGEEAMEIIRNCSAPFPVILSDQRMPGMKGHEFLEKSIEFLPDSIRILMSGYADLDAMIESVNKGRIHRFIAKPWKNEELLNTVQESLEQYDLANENRVLLQTVKNQNKKLHEVALELRRKTGGHRKTISQLDREIKALESKIEALEPTPERIRNTGVKEVEALLLQKDLLNPEGINRVYHRTLEELSEQIHDTASRCGISIHDPLGEGSS
ncbi:MAG: response regulator [Desulfarculaceae bacterium]|nr:response regulator [Desulfarculaceae bacterium]